MCVTPLSLTTRNSSLARLCPSVSPQIPWIGDCLRANFDGRENTAVGAGAIESGDGGNDNTAVGFLAGNDIIGNLNTCLGHSAGSNLIDGEGNIYIGAQVQPGATNELEFIRIGDDTGFWVSV